VGDEITVKVTEIDNMGRINLSRRVVFDKDSQVPGAEASDSSSEDYPFKRRPGGHPHSPRNRQRY